MPCCAEAPPTKRAVVRLLSRMNPFVLSQVPGLSETLAALGAGVRFLSGVNPEQFNMLNS